MARLKIITGLLIVSLLFENSVHSQEVDTAQFQQLLEMTLDEIMNIEIVTASKIPRLSSEITQKVDIVTEQEIGRTISGKRNISELIQYLPGASVKVLSRNDANWGAYGGIGPKYNTYMVNGLPVDAFVDPMSLDALAIKRIEVQRGPASVLYPNYLSQDFAGNQSPLAGTVNLILKERIERQETLLSLSYGSYNTAAGRVYHQNKRGRSHIFAGLSYERSDYTDYGADSTWLNILKDPEYHKGKAFFGATVWLDDEEKNKLTLFGNQTIHRGDFGRINRAYRNNYSLIHANYTSQLSDKLELAFKAGLRAYDREWQEDNFNLNQDLSLRETFGVKQYLVPADISLSLDHLQSSSLTFGADIQRASYLTRVMPLNLDQEILNDAAASQIGVYVQEEMQIDRLTLRAGGRLNMIRYEIDKLLGQLPGAESQHWDVFLWSTGVKYRISENYTVFANAGNSFMSPSLKSIGGTLKEEDIYVPGMNGQLPNPDLQPERGTGLDLGIDGKLPMDLVVSVRFLSNSIKEAIIDNVVSQNPSQTMSVNTEGKTQGKGFEISVKQHLETLLLWHVNMTYTDSRIRDPLNPDQDGAEVPFVPRLMANAGFTLFLPFNIEVSPWMHYGGRIYDSSSIANRNAYESKELLNMMISKMIRFTGDNSLKVYLQAYNLTNNKYKMPWQFQDPGISITFGANFIF